MTTEREKTVLAAVNKALYDALPDVDEGGDYRIQAREARGYMCVTVFCCPAVTHDVHLVVREAYAHCVMGGRLLSLLVAAL